MSKINLTSCWFRGRMRARLATFANPLKRQDPYWFHLDNEMRTAALKGKRAQKLFDKLCKYRNRV